MHPRGASTPWVDFNFKIRKILHTVQEAEKLVLAVSKVYRCVRSATVKLSAIAVPNKDHL